MSEKTYLLDEQYIRPEEEPEEKPEVPDVPPADAEAPPEVTGEEPTPPPPPPPEVGKVPKEEYLMDTEEVPEPPYYYSPLPEEPSIAETETPGGRPTWTDMLYQQLSRPRSREMQELAFFVDKLGRKLYPHIKDPYERTKKTLWWLKEHGLLDVEYGTNRVRVRYRTFDVDEVFAIPEISMPRARDLYKPAEVLEDWSLAYEKLPVSEAKEIVEDIALTPKGEGEEEFSKVISELAGELHPGEKGQMEKTIEDLLESGVLEVYKTRGGYFVSFNKKKFEEMFLWREIEKRLSEKTSIVDIPLEFGKGFLKEVTLGVSELAPPLRRSTSDVEVISLVDLLARKVSGEEPPQMKVSPITYRSGLISVEASKYLSSLEKSRYFTTLNLALEETRRRNPLLFAKGAAGVIGEVLGATVGVDILWGKALKGAYKISKSLIKPYTEGFETGEEIANWLQFRANLLKRGTIGRLALKMEEKVFVPVAKAYTKFYEKALMEEKVVGDVLEEVTGVEKAVHAAGKYEMRGFGKLRIVTKEFPKEALPELEKGVLRPGRELIGKLDEKAILKGFEPDVGEIKTAERVLAKDYIGFKFIPEGLRKLDVGDEFIFFRVGKEGEAVVGALRKIEKDSFLRRLFRIKGKPSYEYELLSVGEFEEKLPLFEKRAVFRFKPEGIVEWKKVKVEEVKPLEVEEFKPPKFPELDFTKIDLKKALEKPVKEAEVDIGAGDVKLSLKTISKEVSEAVKVADIGLVDVKTVEKTARLVGVPKIEEVKLPEPKIFVEVKAKAPLLLEKPRKRVKERDFFKLPEFRATGVPKEVRIPEISTRDIFVTGPEFKQSQRDLVGTLTAPKEALKQQLKTLSEGVSVPKIETVELGAPKIPAPPVAGALLGLGIRRRKDLRVKKYEWDIDLLTGKRRRKRRRVKKKHKKYKRKRRSLSR